jgi:hypothetical protein
LWWTVVLASVVLVGCERGDDGTEAATQEAPLTPAEIESGHSCGDDCRVQVRAAAHAYVERAMPGSTIAGISTKEIDDFGTIWLASVDTGTGQPPLDLIVRYYVSESSEEYWLATPLTGQLSGAINAIATQLLIERSIDAAREAEVDSRGGDPGPSPSEYTGP